MPSPDQTAAGSTLPTGKMRIKITFLEMLGAPSAALPVSLPAEARIERARQPSVAFYRFLYDSVGAPWLWYERRLWSDARIAQTVQDPEVEVWVLSADGQPAGYAELDRRVAGQVELAYFGLMPAFIGRKLGPALLDHAVRRAFMPGVQRLWVHTCTMDHPVALTTYRRAGFVDYDEAWRIIDEPRVLGLIKPGVEVRP